MLQAASYFGEENVSDGIRAGRPYKVLLARQLRAARASVLKVTSPFSFVLDIAEMARINTDDLDQPDLIFVAWSVRVARRAEECLTEAGVEYAVDVEPIGRSLLFNAVRNGAVFYVSLGQAAFCRQRLASVGLNGGIVAEQP